MTRKHGFFEFATKDRMAGNCGKCRGMVNAETGDIEAVVTYGLMIYRDEYRMHVSDVVHPFPYTVADRILIAAKDAIKVIQSRS